MISIKNPLSRRSQPDHQLNVRRARLERDWPVISALRAEAERRLREMGVRQWTDTAHGLDHLARRVYNEELFIVDDGSVIVGCFSLTRNADPDFWSDDPDALKCLYLHTVIVFPFAAHTGVGSFVVRYARDDAVQRGCAALRLDCWRGNQRLREIWEGHGFTYLRDVSAPGRNSGTLMEMRLEVPDARG